MTTPQHAAAALFVIKEIIATNNIDPFSAATKCWIDTAFFDWMGGEHFSHTVWGVSVTYATVCRLYEGKKGPYSAYFKHCCIHIRTFDHSFLCFLLH